MRRIIFLTVAAVLLFPEFTCAALIVNEYIPGSGELVTLDTNTGYHWYYDLTHFVNKTYVEQIDKIANLGTYGNIAGGWHLASQMEMDTLMAIPPDEVLVSFVPTLPGSLFGRYELVNDFHYPSHQIASVHWTQYTGGNVWDLGSFMIDESVSPWTGAWVVSTHSLVPMPGALALAAIGLFPTLGFMRLRRKNQEPGQI